VFDHEIGQSFPVNQYHLLLNIFCIFGGGAFETTRCDENAFLRFHPCERPDKTLNFLLSNCVLPALRLHVNHIQTKAIFGDYAINALLA